MWRGAWRGAWLGAGLAVGCGATDVEVVVSFEASARCGASLPLGDPPAVASLTDLQLYVSEVAAIDAQGGQVPLLLDDDGEWQADDLALLDFEDASGACEWGTPETNTALRGVLPRGGWDGVAFDVAVPEERNHLDLGDAEPPLDRSSMFWGWTVGYKFFALGLELDDAPDPDRWAVEIGSIVCARRRIVPATRCATTRTRSG